MPQLGSLIKMGFYPTPDRVVSLIADRIGGILPGFAPASILDPCCGEGAALAILAERFGVKPDAVHGVELDPERAAAARTRLGGARVASAAFEACKIDGEADMVFLNPPYDEGWGKWRRTESFFLAKAAKTVKRLVVLVVTRRMAEGGDLAEDMERILRSSGLSSISCAWFPSPEIEAFGQFAAFLVPDSFVAAPRHAMAPSGALDEPAGGIEGFYSWSFNSPKQRARPLEIAAASRIDAKATSPASLEAIVGSGHGRKGTLSPLLPMRPEHCALVAAAGMFDGAVVDGKIIKGSVEKIERKSEKIEDTESGGAVHVTTVRQAFSTSMSAMDLATGEVTVISAKDDPERYNHFLVSNAARFAEAAAVTNPPIVGERELESIDLSFAKAPKRLPGRPEGLLPRQIQAAKAVAARWITSKAAIIVGEMSTGKTSTSLAAAAAFAIRRRPENRKILVLCPAKRDLARKWIEEAKAVLATANGGKPAWASEVESITEADRAFARDGLGVIVLRETQAKASSPWRNFPPAGRRHHLDENRRKLTTPVCERCGGAPEVKETRKTVCLNPLPRCPECLKDNKKEMAEVCECGASLVCGEIHWTITGGKSRPRKPIAKHIARKHAHEFILLMDECHCFKGGDTNRGQASMSLISGAHKVLLLTGTIYGGLASSVFHLLHRAMPDFRTAYGHKDVQKFIDDYGLTEAVTKEYLDNGAISHSGSGYKKAEPVVKEVPGTHPAMASWLLPHSVFLQLRDFELAMPPYSEHTLFVKPTPALAGSYWRYINALKQAALDVKKDTGSNGVLSEWSWARFGVLDRPRVPETIAGVEYVPPPGMEMFPKEEALARLVLKEKSEGRKCLVYLQQMNRRDPSPELQRTLARLGVKTAVMRANVDERVEFIRNAINNGADAILTSAALVSEGVDIVECPTIVWFSHEFSSYTMPQASRRSYRLNQTLPVRVYFLAYDETPQADAMARCARKLKAQQVIQGDIANGIALLMTDDDAVDIMSREVSSKRHHESDLTIDDLPPISAYAVPAAAAAADTAAIRTRAPIEDPAPDSNGHVQLLFDFAA